MRDEGASGSGGRQLQWKCHGQAGCRRAARVWACTLVCVHAPDALHTWEGMQACVQACTTHLQMAALRYAGCKLAVLHGRYYIVRVSTRAVRRQGVETAKGGQRECACWANGRKCSKEISAMVPRCSVRALMHATCAGGAPRAAADVRAPTALFDCYHCWRQKQQAACSEHIQHCCPACPIIKRRAFLGPFVVLVATSSVAHTHCSSAATPLCAPRPRTCSLTGPAPSGGVTACSCLGAAPGCGCR